MNEENETPEVESEPAPVVLEAEPVAVATEPEPSADDPNNVAPDPIFGVAGPLIWTLNTPSGPVKFYGDSAEEVVRLYNDSAHTSFTAKQLNPTTITPSDTKEPE